MTESHLILGIGELLWDLLPANRKSRGIPIPDTSYVGFLGGAPANFAVMAGRLGNRAVVLSRIGRDELGCQAISQLDPLPIDASSMQVDPAHETGRVTVDFEGSEPQYTIHQPAAWDFLELTDEWVRLAERADAICFGSLAQRSPISRQTIQTMAAESAANCIRVFDANLRQPFYSIEIVEESLELTTVLKLNENELPQILTLLGLDVDENSNPDQLRSGAERLLDEFPSLELIAVTRGSRGSLLVRRNEWHEHPGISVQLADPIGSGDAFTAALVHYLLRGASLPALNEAGNRWGAWVASQPGAMPALPPEMRAFLCAAIESSQG